MKQRIPYIAPLGVMCVAFLLMLCVWPLGLIGHATYESNSAERGMTLSAPISTGVVMEGAFTPTRSHINSISLRFNTRTDVNVVDGVLHFSLMDSDGVEIYSSEVDCTAIKNNDFEDFLLDMELAVGESYLYRVTTEGCSDGAPRIYLGSTGVGPIEQIGFGINGASVDKRPVIKLAYEDSLTLRKALVYDVTILLIAMFVLFMMRQAKWDTGIMRKACIYACFVLIGTMVILLFDESAKPLVTPGNELHRNFGAPAYGYTSVNEDSGASGAFVSTDRYALNRGSYSVSVEYTASMPGCSITLIDNGLTILEEQLPSTETYLVFPFTLEKDCQDLQIILNYGGAGLFTVYSISLNPGTRFYRDTIYYAIVFLLLNAFGLGLYFYQKKHPMSTATKATGVILVGVAVLSFFPYLNGSLPWADDICYHLIRIEGIKDAMRDGQFPAYIYPEGLNGYGYLNSMYPYLFLYIPAFIRLFGVSIAASYKTLIFLCHLACAFITYGSMKSIYPKRAAALAVSVLYCLCTYRFTNFYARGAVGEALAMTFFPLLLAGLYHVLTGNHKKWYLLALGMSGLLQTHILSAMLGALICALGGIVFFTQAIRKERILAIAKAAGATVLWNLWFLVPFLYYYKNANFRLSAVDYSTYSESSLLLSDLAGIINLDRNRTLTLGLVIILCAGFALFHLLVKKREEEETFSPSFFRFLLVLGLVCVMLLLGQFSAWSFMELTVFEWFFKKLQFPWRLLGQASLFLIMAGCIGLYESTLLKKYAATIVIGLSLLSMLPITLYHEDQFMYETYTDTTSVGHQSKLIGIPKGENTCVYPFEWRRDGLGDAMLLANCVRLSNPEAVTILNYRRTGTTSQIAYTSTEEGSQIEFPIQYFYGYLATDENGQTVEIAPSDNQVVSFHASGDGATHTVTLKYRQPIVFLLGNLLSILGIVGSAWWIRKEKRDSVLD